MPRVLLLGGTTEAAQIARALADAGRAAVYSYAGRTGAPLAQPLPVRVGGFGGADGLAAYLRAEGISHVIDATHPFAAGMSANAVAACAEVGCALIALQRQPWVAGPQDRWTAVPDIPAAVGALPDAAARIFLAIGRQHLNLFSGAPQHHYLLRLVDAPQGARPLPHTEIVLARGPFRVEDDVALLRQHGVQIVVAKNSGGSGARAKIEAAALLGVPVVMIDRPALPDRMAVETVGEVMAWLGHPALRGV